MAEGGSVRVNPAGAGSVPVNPAGAGSSRRRILLAVHDVELGIELVAALEDAGHYAEHVFEIAEALPRASIALPDALVVDLAAPGVDYGVLRRWAEQTQVPLVVLSGSSSGERLARRLGATFFERPRRNDDTWTDAYVDVVQTAISRAESAPIPQAADGDAPSGVRRRSSARFLAPNVLIAAPGANAREVVASFVRSELGLQCIAVEDAAAATLALHRAQKGIRAVVMDRRLAQEAAGAALDRTILEFGIAMIPLRVGSDDDAASVGRAAWDVAPLLRAALGSKRERAV